MFDKPRDRATGSPREPAGPRIGPEDERIALRCNRRELQLVDSFVANGEFRTRSDLMRVALREFLRSRALSGVAAPVPTDGPVPIAVPFRRDEVATLVAYAKLVGNQRPLGDLIAELARRGELEMKVRELVLRHRLSVQEAD